MPACRCYGVLAAIAAQLLRWSGLRSRRPNVTALPIRCEVCGKVWRVELRVTPGGTG